mgnify:CR=1 FL=1
MDLIANIVDVFNLSKNLYLTTKLMIYNKPIIVALNMIDMVKSNGIEIYVKKLEKELWVKVVSMVSKKK